MNPDDFDMEKLEASLPEALRNRLAEARHSLFEEASSPWSSDHETSGPTLWVDDELVAGAVDKFLSRSGVSRLSSLEFWDLYQAGRERGLPAAKALDEAMEKTPHITSK